MTIAVLSDIHGNYVALEKCLAYAEKQGAEAYIFLGDYVGELAYPDRTMWIIKQLDTQPGSRMHCYFVKGNKEEYWLEKEKGDAALWKEGDSTTGSLLYTYERLTQNNLDFFADLPLVQVIAFNGLPAITCCHGSPLRVNEKLLQNSSRSIAAMKQIATPVLLCGHTHVQMRMEWQDKIMWNPGSVGISHHNKAQFLLLHGEDGWWHEEWISLDYDVKQVIKDLYMDKLDKYAPCWTMVTEQILNGYPITHGEVLTRAMELCMQDTGTCIWPDIPELYWEKAVRDCGIARECQ